jgi:hypothetical protein
MQNSIFYVKDNSDKNLVAAKFLYNGGAPVLDPNFGRAETRDLYDSNGNLLPTQNIHGYLIVPSDYSVQNAIKFAQSVSDEMTTTVEGPDGQEMTDFGPALEVMVFAFLSGGSQDLQTVYNGKKGEFMSAFTDAASFNLGLVTAYSGIPLSWAELGGGAYNEIKNHFTHPKHPLDTRGIDGLSEINSNSVQAGYKFGIGLLGSQSQASADRPLKQVDHDRVPSSATKTHEPAPAKPAASHTSADLDMFDTYERLFSHMTGEPTDENILYSSAQAGPDAPELYDQVNAIVAKLFRTGLREAPNYSAPGDSAAIPAHGTALGAPGLPAGSSRSGPATGGDRGDVDRADAGQHPIFPRRRGHVASGHRNEAVFIYTNVNAGGTTGATQGSDVSLN